jgi:hypothetical protein
LPKIIIENKNKKEPRINTISTKVNNNQINELNSHISYYKKENAKNTNNVKLTKSFFVYQVVISVLNFYLSKEQNKTLETLENLLKNTEVKDIKDKYNNIISIKLNDKELKQLKEMAVKYNLKLSQLIYKLYIFGLDFLKK